MQNLVVVESPAKSKTISRYLNKSKDGESYTILATGGHIYETTKIDIDNQFNPNYELIETKKKFVSEIAKSMQKSQRLYLATDPDREGEAISYHIHDWLEKQGKLKNKPVHRIVFHEVTGKAILDAINNPSEISHNLVNAQQARDALDQLVGFNLSQLLMRKLSTMGLSAGRVQSPALRLIVERQREINSFRSQEYWTIKINLAKDVDSAQGNIAKFAATLTHQNCNKIDKLGIRDETSATEVKSGIEAELNVENGRQMIEVAKVAKKITRKKPFPPFTTSTLVQDASRKLKMSARQTASVAQKLYEGLTVNGEQMGLITYTRTDSVTLSSSAIQQIRSYIESNMGQDRLPAKGRIYKTKSKNAQEAHEAIRPTDISLTPQKVRSSLTNEQYQLYRLIWNRAVACQMNDAEYNSVTAVFSTVNYSFQANGSTLLKPGWMELDQSSQEQNGSDSSSDIKNKLPALVEGEFVNVDSIEPEQHFTQPPPRFTTASLIRQLEEHGIGRPSTWPTIITKLQARNYVEMDKQSFIAKGLGCTVVDYLVEHFVRYVDYEFTGELEDGLDEVARGERQRVDLLENFWKEFSIALDAGMQKKPFRKKSRRTSRE